MSYTHLGKGCDVGLVSNMAAAVWEDTCTALHDQTELATHTVQHATVLPWKQCWYVIPYQETIQGSLLIG